MNILDKFYNLIRKLSNSFLVEEMAEDIFRISPYKLTSNNPKKLLISSLTHGDEIIGIHLLVELLEKLNSNDIQLNCILHLSISNKEAFLANQRYIDVDLNRSYSSKDITKKEVKLAHKIKKIADISDYILDIHQTIQPTISPFFILPYSEEYYLWLSNLIPEIPVILRRDIENATTLSTYGYLKNKFAVTIEVGANGVEESHASQ